MDTILLGTDPYLIDLACARIAGFHSNEIGTLNGAEQKGLLNSDHRLFVDSLNLEKIQIPFIPPQPGPLASFIHSPKRQKHFLKIRNTKMFSYLASTDWFGKILFLSGLRQDIFIQDEMSCNGIYLKEEDCTQCNICQDLCPLGLDLPGYLMNTDEKCIHCLYCYSGCPEQAIKFNGDFGFFREQLKQYGDMVRTLYN